MLTDICRYFGGKKTPFRFPQDKWLVYFLTCVAVLFLMRFAREYAIGVVPGHEYGWDAVVTCAGVQAHLAGLNSYYVKNLQGTDVAYSYLPVTLDMFRPICSHSFFRIHFRILDILLTGLSAFFISTYSFSGQRMRDGLLKTLFIFGGFAGFTWTFRTGNIAMVTGSLLALALALFYRGFTEQEKKAHDRKAGIFYGIGAAVLGFELSIKITFVPLIVALYFLPLARGRKIGLIAIAGIFYLVPILISRLFYPSLFPSWLGAISGDIPGQFSPATETCSHGLLCMADILAGGVHSALPLLPTSLSVGILYLLASAAILGMLIGVILWLVGEEGSECGESFLARLDRFLVDNPVFAMRLVPLVMLAIFLCGPRLKEYVFFDAAILVSVLAADLPPGELAVLFAAAIVGSLLANNPEFAYGDHPLQLTGFLFNQIFAGLLCYVILLGDLVPAFRRLKEMKAAPAAERPSAPLGHSHGSTMPIST